MWNNPEWFKRHITVIGTFHLICAYMKMVGKKIAGSGFSDILLEAGLISSGSIEGVLKGKHYERAMNRHKVMMECLEQLLMEKFLSHKDHDQLLESLPEETQRKLKELVYSPSVDSLNTVITDEGLIIFLPGPHTACSVTA